MLHNFAFSSKEEETRRERPKSALYLGLEIVKGGPFGLCETPVGCKIGKKLKGDPWESLNFRKNFKMRFSNSGTVPKNIKRGPFGIF